MLYVGPRKETYHGLTDWLCFPLYGCHYNREKKKRNDKRKEQQTEMPIKIFPKKHILEYRGLHSTLFLVLYLPQSEYDAL